MILTVIIYRAFYVPRFFGFQSFFENICKVTVKKSQVIESFKIELRDKGCSYVTHLRSIANINHWKVSHGQLTVYCLWPPHGERPLDLGLTWILLNISRLRTCGGASYWRPCLPKIYFGGHVAKENS